MVTADQASDIDAVLRLARETNVKVIIAGGAESWMVADRLAAANVPVVVGSMSNIPTSFATLGSRQETPALLRRSGAKVVLIGNGSGDESVFNVRNLKYDAGVAVAFGMTWDDALRAITLTPAEDGSAVLPAPVNAGHRELRRPSRRHPSLTFCHPERAAEGGESRDDKS